MVILHLKFSQPKREWPRSLASSVSARGQAWFGNISRCRDLLHLALTGQTAIVCGDVASGEYEANVQSQPTLLDLEKPSPDTVFTTVI
jgi:hypothetical protein